MQRYAIVIYDKRTGDVFTTLMQAEDGTAAVAAMNRKDWGGIFGGIFGALVAAAIWVPVAYLTRGYWAVGGEVFLVGLAAGLGAWLGGDPRG